MIFLPAVLLISSCGEGTYNSLTVSEIKSVEDYVMSSYFLLRGDASLADSRTAWPAHTLPLSFPAAGSTKTSTKQNFPEKGQRTTVTITPTGTADVYKVVNVTTYPNREEVIESTTESYYVKDITTPGVDLNPDEIYDENDLLWDVDSDAQDFNARIKYETAYMDGTVRYEDVYATTTEDSILYAAFDINGSLSFPEPDGNGTWAPADDPSALYSSMVTYQQQEGSIFDFWSDYKIIIGTRYYTEHGDSAKPTKTSVTYERIIERSTEDSTLEERIDGFFERLFSGDPTSGVYAGETLTETVIRYEILPNNKKTVMTESEIFDSNNGASIVTFTAHYEEDENGVITYSGEPVAVY